MLSCCLWQGFIGHDYQLAGFKTKKVLQYSIEAKRINNKCMFVFCQETEEDNVEQESEDEDKLKKESEDEDKLEKESEDEDKLEKESEDYKVEQNGREHV